MPHREIKNHGGEVKKGEQDKLDREREIEHKLVSEHSQGIPCGQCTETQ